MGKLLDEERIEYIEIGESILMEKEFWKRVMLWLSKHGVKVEETRQRSRGAKRGAKTARLEDISNK